MSVVAEGVASGEIRSVDPTLTAAALFGAIHGVATLIVDPHEDVPLPDPAGLVEAVIDVSFNGVAAGRDRPVEV